MYANTAVTLRRQFIEVLIRLPIPQLSHAIIASGRFYTLLINNKVQMTYALIQMCQ